MSNLQNFFGNGEEFIHDTLNISRRALSVENIPQLINANYSSWFTGSPYFLTNTDLIGHIEPQQGLEFVDVASCTEPNIGLTQPNIDFAQPRIDFAPTSSNLTQSHPCYYYYNHYNNYGFSYITNPMNNHPFLQPRNQYPPNINRRQFFKRNKSADNIPQQLGIGPALLKVLSKRYWENVANKKTAEKPGFDFTVMSYNVLAQDLIKDHSYLYRTHNQRALEWKKRWNNIYEEIKVLQPDILCLQEVQESHIPKYYSAFENMGYKGIYKKRTGIRCDGCAIYYKTDRIALVEYETVEFYQPNVTVLNRDNVAIVAKFCPKDHRRNEFIVATTHLLYNPKRQDVRLAQTQLLLAEVERMSFDHKLKSDRSDTPYLPIIITGDFNSTPNSGVYTLVTKGYFKYCHLSARSLDVKKDAATQGNVLIPCDLEITDKCQHAKLLSKRLNNEEITRTEEAALIKLHNGEKNVAKVSSEVIKNPELFCTGTVSHLFNFKSVYDHGEGANVEGTTFQDEWITVDYIFYSGKKRDENETKEDKLKLISRYRLPRKNELGRIKIPNGLMGSDHLSLMGKFKLKL